MEDIPEEYVPVWQADVDAGNVDAGNARIIGLNKAT